MGTALAGTERAYRTLGPDDRAACAWCGKPATGVEAWRTPIMLASAFAYFCAAHDPRTEEYTVITEQRGPYTVYRVQRVGDDEPEGAVYQTRREAENGIDFFRRTGR